MLHEHTVTQGDRLDNVTAHYLGDPEQFWRVCDANNAMRPAELEEVGRRVRITLPEGVPGAQGSFFFLCRSSSDQRQECQRSKYQFFQISRHLSVSTNG